MPGESKPGWERFSLRNRMVKQHHEGAPPDGAHAQRCVVALERRLHRCRNVVTLGVRPNLEDYSAADLALLPPHCSRT